MTTTLLVYFPMWGWTHAPSVVFWYDANGKLVEYAPNPDAYSVSRARMEVNRKKPETSWPDHFDYLEARNPNPSWWELFEGVDLSEDIPKLFDEFVATWR